MKLVNIGFGNLISAERVLAVVSPESAPIKRMIQEARERGNLVHASLGRRSPSVLVLVSAHVVLSAPGPVEIAQRLGTPVEEEELRP